MLKQKVIFIASVAPKVATAVFTSKVTFSKSPTNIEIFGLLLYEIFLSISFKSSPIWSHCVVATACRLSLNLNRF